MKIKAEKDDLITLEESIAEQIRQAEILVKIHPDVLAGKKQAHLLHAKRHPQVRLLSEGKLWLDGLQLEKGKKMTDFEE